MNRRRILITGIIGIMTLIAIGIIVVKMNNAPIDFGEITRIKDIEPQYSEENRLDRQVYGRFKTFLFDTSWGTKTLTLFDKRFPTEYSYQIDDKHICRAYLYSGCGEKMIYFKIFTYAPNWGANGNWCNYNNDYYMCTYPSEEQVDMIKKGTKLSQVVKLFPNVKYEIGWGKLYYGSEKVYGLYEGGLCVLTVNTRKDDFEYDGDFRVIGIEKIHYGETYEGENGDVAEILKCREFIESFLAK